MATPLLRASSVPPDRIVFHRADTIEPGWASVAAISLGQGGLDHHVLVEEAGIPRLRLDLRGTGDFEAWYCAEAISWNGTVVIGFAERVYFIGMSGIVIARIDLRLYFERFYVEGDRLLVASGTDVTCVDMGGNLIWQSDWLGVDGVIIHRVRDGVIYGDGEWNPPGGWKPFAISLTDGRSVLDAGAKG